MEFISLLGIFIDSRPNYAHTRRTNLCQIQCSRVHRMMWNLIRIDLMKFAFRVCVQRSLSQANGNCRATSHRRQHPDVLVYGEANVSHENWFYIHESWTSNYHHAGSQIYLPQFTTSWFRVCTKSPPRWLRIILSSVNPTICSIYLFYAFPLDILIRRK